MRFPAGSCKDLVQVEGWLQHSCLRAEYLLKVLLDDRREPDRCVASVKEMIRTDCTPDQNELIAARLQRYRS
jgi:hypothetical protein